MPTNGAEWLTWIISQALVAAAIWGGIRADIRNLHDKAKSAQDAADKAHSRIDDLLHAGETGNHQFRRR